MSATREEALEIMHSAVDTMTAQILLSFEEEAELREALAVLSSCACKGREPIGEEGGTVYIRGSRAYAEVGSGMFRIDYPKGLKDGQRLLVLIFETDESEKERT